MATTNQPLNKATIKTLRGIAHAIRRAGFASMAGFNMTHMVRLQTRGLLDLDAGYWSASLTDAGRGFIVEQDFARAQAVAS